MFNKQIKNRNYIFYDRSPFSGHCGPAHARAKYVTAVVDFLRLNFPLEMSASSMSPNNKQTRNLQRISRRKRRIHFDSGAASITIIMIVVLVIIDTRPEGSDFEHF